MANLMSGAARLRKRLGNHLHDPATWRGSWRCKQENVFFFPTRLTQRMSPLLKEVKEGLAHLRPGPVARHACKSLEKPALQQEKRILVEARWRCGKARSMQGRMRVQRCFGGQSAEGQPWRVGFVETSTRVTQAYKERGPSPASGRRTAAGAL